MPRAGSLYSGQHGSERAAWQARLDTGEIVMCWRCRGRRINPKHWQLGHRTHLGLPSHPECPGCNMRAGGRIGAAITNAKRARRRPVQSRQW